MKIRDTVQGLQAEIKMVDMGSGVDNANDLLADCGIEWNDTLEIYETTEKDRLDWIITYAYEVKFGITEWDDDDTEPDEDMEIIVKWDNHVRNNSTPRHAVYYWGGRQIEATECMAIPMHDDDGDYCADYEDAVKVSGIGVYGVIFGKFPENFDEFAEMYGKGRINSDAETLQTIIY